MPNPIPPSASLRVPGGFLCAFLLSARAAYPQAQLYVSPDGGGATCSLASPCALEASVTKVRAANAGMTGDIVVFLRGGTYALARPLVLGPQDGGKNGFRIVYQAYAGETPILSGGRAVTGWTLHDAGKNIYKAAVALPITPRQLFVNDKRAVRARGPENPAGYSQTSSGFTGPAQELGRWLNPRRMEVVGFNEWRSFRCGVASVSGGNLALQANCIQAARRDSWPFNKVTWVENDYSLLDQDGEWYYDADAAILYYRPRAGEDMSKAQVVVPILENLLTLAGTAANPLVNVTLKGLAFMHATWLHPNQATGFTPIQATQEAVGGNQTTGAVRADFASNLIVERNVFRQLGGDGLAMGLGEKRNLVVGNVFQDISANGIRLGNVDDPNPANPAYRTEGNAIRNNYITQAASEYHSAIGVWIGYADSTALEHNEIHDLPYSGVSVSWGWGKGPPNYSRRNHIKYNLIYNYLHTLRDGGGIYTLGPQPGTEVAYNYLHHQPTSSGALYPDEGTQGTLWHDNVVSSVTRWLHLWTQSIKQNTVRNNYTDSPDMLNNGVENVVESNTVIKGGAWPDPAKKIMAEAGLEPAFQDIRNKGAQSSLARDHTAGKSLRGLERGSVAYRGFRIDGRRVASKGVGK